MSSQDDPTPASVNGDGETATETTCGYSFDPATRPDARLQTTWECPHEPYGDTDRCVFHMTHDQRTAHEITAEEIVAELEANLAAEDPRTNEYVGADLPHLSLTYQDVNGDTNHVINLQYADIEGIDLTHGHLEQGLNLREATVGTLTLEDATVDGEVQASSLVVEDGFSAYESRFNEDVDFTDAAFEGVVNCDETTFDDDTYFDDATFHDEAHFRNASARGSSHVLDDHISFAGATFRSTASFRQSNFEYVTFEDAQFQGTAHFEHVTLDGHAVFSDVVFDQVADFDEARFYDDATFDGVRFRKLAEFRGAEFAGGARSTDDDVTFQDATFDAEADFELAQFRYANFENATFGADCTLTEAAFDGGLEARGIEVAGVLSLGETTFEDTVDCSDGRLEGRVLAREAAFRDDAAFEATTFAKVADFDESRFHEDASFQNAHFRAEAKFQGTVFDGQANHIEENASFKGCTFDGDADFTAARFTNASFWNATFGGECSFKHAVFENRAKFRVDGDGSNVYVDMTDATVNGGHVVEKGGDVVPYDFTRTTLGNVTLEGDGNAYELLDYFRFCLTEFDHFDFGDHHDYLERNDWDIHTFVDTPAPVQPAVEMDSAVIEETYRRAQASADDVGDKEAKRNFEFKRWYYNRQKNWHLVRNEYSLNALTRTKKIASVGLNLFMQYTCGYANRVPRIFITMGVFTLLYGILYTLGGPFETQAGVVWQADQPLVVLFDAVYYSGISFTTIGYGDIGPLGWAAKILAMSEGYLSAILFTLLTVTLLRSAIGSS